MGLGRTDHPSAVDVVLDRLAHVHAAGVEVDVAPAQPGQFAPAKTRRGYHLDDSRQDRLAPLFGRSDEPLHQVFYRRDLRWCVARWRRGGASRRRRLEHAPLHGLAQSGREDPVQVMDAAWVEALVEPDPVGAIEALACQAIQPDMTELLIDPLDLVAVALDGRWRAARPDVFQPTLEEVGHGSRAGDRYRPFRYAVTNSARAVSACFLVPRKVRVTWRGFPVTGSRPMNTRSRHTPGDLSSLVPRMDLPKVVVQE